MSPLPSNAGGLSRESPSRGEPASSSHWNPLHGSFVMGHLHHDCREASGGPPSPRDVASEPSSWVPPQPPQQVSSPYHHHPHHHHHQPQMTAPQHPARVLKDEVARAMRNAAHVHGQWSFFLTDIEGMLQRLYPSSYQREMFGEVVRLLVEAGDGSLGEGNSTFHLNRLAAPSHAPAVNTPPRTASSSSLLVPPGFLTPPSKKAMLLVDGGYYEAIQWGVLDKFGTGYVVDVRRLVRRLEEIYEAQFVRRHYVQGTENGTLSSFHKMLTSPENKGPGFTVDIHKMREQSVRRGVAVAPMEYMREKASIMVEQGVDVAISMEILRTTMKGTYDSLVVITGDAGLEPAFRVVSEENRERELLKEKVQELYVLGGQKMSHELFTYARGVRGQPVVFLETIMKECVVKKEELEKSLLNGDAMSYLSTMSSSSTSTPPAMHKSLSNGARSSLSSWPSDVSLSAKGLRSSSSDTGSEEGNGSTGRGVTVRWCSYGATCKFLACPDENMAHFKKYGHMCPDDQNCPFMLDYATHRRSEKGKVHFGLWRHSCPKGANCNFVEHPELHKKHMEKFTHDCYDECPPTPTSVLGSSLKTSSTTTGPSPSVSSSRLAHLWAPPVEPCVEAEEDCGMPLVLLKDVANLLLDESAPHHRQQQQQQAPQQHQSETLFMNSRSPFMLGGGISTGGGAAQQMSRYGGAPMVIGAKDHQLVFTQAA